MSERPTTEAYVAPVRVVYCTLCGTGPLPLAGWPTDLLRAMGDSSPGTLRYQCVRVGCEWFVEADELTGEPKWTSKQS